MPEIENKVPIMRTIPGCIEELKKLDPNTEVKQNFVRNLVLNHKVKSTKAGSKYLVNFCSLLSYLSNSEEQEINDSVDSTPYGALRKVK